MVAAAGVGLGDSLGPAVGDGDVSGDADAEGLADGDAAAAWRLKLAQGFGCTLAHSLCTPGASPGNGFTTFVKLPPPSAVTLAATREELSQ